MQQADPSYINSQTVVKKSNVDLVISRMFNADHVPPALIETVRQYQQHMLGKGISQSLTLKDAAVKQCNIHIDNITLDLKSIDDKELMSCLQLPSSAVESDKKDTGKLNWSFEGINQFESITIRIKDRLWEVEFARLGLPQHNIFNHQTELKTKAHSTIYDKLCTNLAPVERSAPCNAVVLQGGPGLGKTYCAQYYFYHKAASQHQMVAWLSGNSKEAFLKDWQSLAQQLRNLQTSESTRDDDTVIYDWCENQLGQWLFIIDEVNVSADFLNSHLPKVGGHILLTTHQPNYQLQPNQITLTFSPLSFEDSKELLQTYVGRYWQATGHPQEQKALNYIISALGGYPTGLMQMALLIHKECISFERLANQFKQPTLRIYFLSDTVFGQLKDYTFMAAVKKGWVQLLDYFNEYYPQLEKEKIEQYLKQFINFLEQEIGKEATTISEELTVNQIKDNAIQLFWKTIERSSNTKFDMDNLTAWLHCLPLSYDGSTQQWQLSLASLSALKFQSNAEFLTMPILKSISIQEKEEVLLSKALEMPKIPSDIRMSISLENSSLKHIEIKLLTIGKPSEITTWQLPTVNPYFIPRPELTRKLVTKLPGKKQGETSAQLLLAAVTGMGGIGKTELARHFITSDLSSHYQRRFWLTATNDSQLRMEFRELAVYLGLVDTKKYIEDQELIDHIHKWLSIHPGWLMVLDNADEYNSIAHWIPKEGGAVLITTREPNPGTLSPEQIVPVPLLTLEEAVNWLYQLSGRHANSSPVQEIEAAKKLVNDLGYLPLAIAQAAAYLREQPNVSVADYHIRYSTLFGDTTLAQQKESETGGKDPDIYSRQIVARTWMLSLQAIETYAPSQNIPNIVYSLVIMCAYLAPKDIPVILVENWLKKFFEFEPSTASYFLDEYIGQLLRYSLLERDSIIQGLSMHRLEQEAVRYNYNNEKNFHTVLLSVCIALLDESALSLNQELLTNLLYRRRLIGHVETVLEHWQANVSKYLIDNEKKKK